MKKILISISIILTMLFSFIIDSSLQVSASSPDLSKYDYVYDFSEFGGYTDFVYVTHPDTDKEFFFDKDTTKLYTNMPYCTFVEYDLYSVDNGKYNGNSYYVFLSYSEFEFERVIGTTSDGSVSWDTITFDDDDFSNNIDSMVSFAFKPGEKYSLQDVFIHDDYTRLNTFFFETSDFSKSLSNLKSLGISNVAKVTEIFYSNFELNDYILPFSADSLTVTYKKTVGPAGKPMLDENGNVIKDSFWHSFTFTAKQDCVVDLSIYDSNVVGFASGDPVENYKPYLWWRRSTVNSGAKFGSIISVDEAIDIKRGAISATFSGHEDEFVNRVQWYYNTYMNDLHRRYYNLTGKMIFTNMPFIDEFDLDWQSKSNINYSVELESWARTNNILIDYTGKIAIKRINNFKGDYFKLNAGQTYTYTINESALSLLYQERYTFIVTYAGSVDDMISTGVKRKVLTARHVENGYYLYPAAWSFTYSFIAKQTDIDRDKYNEDDILNDNYIYDENGNIIGEVPNENTNINGNYGDINTGLDGIISNGNFDLINGLKNIGGTMTGFFGMMAGFFSFLPTVIWSLLGVLLTICIALRILGR